MTARGCDLSNGPLGAPLRTPQGFMDSRLKTTVLDYLSLFLNKHT